MYLRLAFSVAAHLEPDVLIVDEVLAVGDAEFQRRCLGRMSEAEKEGRTVVFVSHDLAALQRLCARAMWLESGQIRAEGETRQIVRDYLTSGFVPAGETATASGGGQVRLLRTTVEPASGGADQALLQEDPLRVVVEIEVLEELLGLDVAVFVTSSRGVRVLDEALSDRHQVQLGKGRHRIAMEVPPVLNVGQYTVGLWIGTSTLDLLDEPAVATFTLHGSDANRPDRAVVLGLPFSVTGP
jgi:ABC-type sulfate/molybdate transport systems ATPase subunit